MIKIENYSDMFTDAAVADEQGNLIFASIWARTAHINALYGKIVNQELRKLVIDGKQYAVNKDLQKTHTRLPKENYYGSDLCHAFIYAEQTQEARAGRRIIIGDKSNDSDYIWSIITNMSDIGLLEQWKLPVLRKMITEKMIVSLEQCYGINNASLINISDNEKFEKIISDLLKSQEIAA